MNGMRKVLRELSRGTRLASVAIAGFVLAACGQEGDARAAEGRGAPPVTIGPENIAVAKTAELRTGPRISGSLAPENEATARAEVAGAVLETFAEQGQSVKRGTVLARIDDTAIRDAYLSAKSAVRSAETALQVARRDAERSATLAAAGAIAERELETARWNVTNAEATLADAQARLASAEEQVEKTTVRAPLSGVISQRHVNAGDVVSVGGEMFTVVDPSSMRLEAAVPAEQLGALKVGAPVEFAVSGYPGRSFTGRIERINPTADPATRQVGIFVQIPNAGRALVAGLFAEGRVASESRTGVVVPISAVDERGLAPTVMRIENGQVEQVEVQLGLREEQSETVEIRAGIAEGDTVLLGAAQGIAKGTPVRVVAPADQPATAPQSAERR